MPTSTPKKTTTTTGAAKPAQPREVAIVDLKDIYVQDGFNPRTLIEEQALAELAASIAENGLIEALGVVPRPEKAGTWLLTSGHRRYEGCTRARLERVPIIIGSGDVRQRKIDAMVSNRHRVDLDPYDEAMTFAEMRELNMTNRAIGVAMGASDKLVADRLVLAELPRDLAERFRDRWPTGLVRTVRAMCDLSGGEVFARVIADRIDSLDGSVEGALEQLRHDPVDYIDRLASSHGKRIAGVLAVESCGARPGGGFKGGPRWGVYSHRGYLEPDELGKITDQGLADKLKALRGADAREAWAHHQRYRIFLDQGALDALRAANVLFSAGDHERGVCIQLDALRAVCEPIIEADYTAFLKAKATETRRVTQGGPEAQQRADERAREMARTSAARDRNLQLGEKLAGQLSEAPLTLDYIKLVCRMAIEAAAEDMGAMGGIRKLCERGLRYVIPGWQQEVVAKSTGAISHRYPGEGTKNRTGERTRADEDPEKLLWEWWELAHTPGQVMGRTLQIIAAARMADQDAVPQSRRAYGTPFQHGEIKTAFDALVTPRIKAAPAARAPARRTAAAARKPAADSRTAARRPASPAARPRAAARQPSAGDQADAALAAVGVHEATVAAAIKGLKGNDVTLAKRALAIVKTKPGVSIPEVADHLRVAHNTLYRVLPKLAGNNAIHQRGRKWYLGAAVGSSSLAPGAAS